MRYVLILFVALMVVGCSQKAEDGGKYSPKDEKGQEVCIGPNNPYHDGGGHDAGFNWALDNGGGCNGNSDSFNEGCEEFHRQLDEFNRCEERKRKK
jgi:hypothetical protein